MTFDWFLVLTPILLLPLLLLFCFAGCSGKVEYSYPNLTFVLHDSLSVPADPVTNVRFRWIREGADFQDPPVYVDEFEVITVDSGEQVRVFRHRPEQPEGGLWTVTCFPFSSQKSYGEASCGPFELISSTGEISVEFEIIPDQHPLGRVRVRQGGCPPSS